MYNHFECPDLNKYFLFDLEIVFWTIRLFSFQEWEINDIDVDKIKIKPECTVNALKIDPFTTEFKCQ